MVVVLVVLVVTLLAGGCGTRAFPTFVFLSGWFEPLFERNISSHRPDRLYPS